MFEQFKVFSHNGRACVVIDICNRHSVAYVEIREDENASQLADSLGYDFNITLEEDSQIGLDSRPLHGNIGFRYMEKKIKELAESLP